MTISPLDFELDSEAIMSLLAQEVETSTMADQKRGSYIGCSIIGHPCDRKIWMSWKGCDHTPKEPRILRIFERGHEIEDWLVRSRLENLPSFDLKDRQREVSRGSLKGHIDGILTFKETGVDFLLEIKSMNDRSFQTVKKQGLWKAHPVYAAQMQVYMLLLGLKDGFFLSVNKNTEELYFEYVILIEEYAESLVQKAERIALYGEHMPDALSSRTLECKMCHHRSFCHPEEEAS